MGTKVKLTNVRLFFPDLFEAKKFQGKPDSKPRYSATFGIDKSDVAQIAKVNAAIQEVAKEEWKDKAPQMIASFANNSNKFCFMDGKTKTYDGVDDKWVLSSHRQASDGKPDCRGTRKDVKLTENDGTLYSGCYVIAILEIWAQSGANPGIRCSLLGVQKYADGDAFSGGGRAKDDDFDDISVPEDEEELA